MNKIRSPKPLCFLCSEISYLKNRFITGMVFNGRSFLMKYATKTINIRVLQAIFNMLFSIGRTSEIP